DRDRGRHLERVLVDLDRERAVLDRPGLADLEPDRVRDAGGDRGGRGIFGLDDAGVGSRLLERRIGRRGGGHARATRERDSEGGDDRQNVDRSATHCGPRWIWVPRGREGRASDWRTHLL